jgi:hypothetical protein
MYQQTNPGTLTHDPSGNGVGGTELSIAVYLNHGTIPEQGRDGLDNTGGQKNYLKNQTSFL